MAGRGRPPTGTPILVRIPDDLLHLIDVAATNTGRSRAAQIRHILDSYLKQEPQ